MEAGGKPPPLPSILWLPHVLLVGSEGETLALTLALTELSTSPRSHFGTVDGQLLCDIGALINCARVLLHSTTNIRTTAAATLAFTTCAIRAAVQVPYSGVGLSKQVYS